MRNFLLFMIVAAALVADDKYAIQVLSVKDKSSVSSDFMQKVNRVSMPSKGQEGRDGNFKVYYGGIKTYKSAALVLPYIQEKVSTDAFILKEKDIVMSPHKPTVKSEAEEKSDKEAEAAKKKMQAQMKMAAASIKPIFKDMPLQGKRKASAEKAKSEQVRTEQVKVEQVEILAPVPMQEPIIASTSMTVQAAVQRDETACMETELHRANRKSKRVLEIAEAIAFYENSPHYSFKK